MVSHKINVLVSKAEKKETDLYCKIDFYHLPFYYFENTHVSLLLHHGSTTSMTQAVLPILQMKQ